MAKPNSALTLIRRILVRIIEPGPDPGEAWCLDCSLNGGRTLVLPADGYKPHAISHADGQVQIRACWPGKPARHG